MPNYGRRVGQSRRGFMDGATVSRGLLFIAAGGLFMAILVPMLLTALQLNGKPGTLTVSSCVTGGGSHPVITCTGDFQLTSGGPRYTGASLSEQQSYPAGTLLKVQQATDGSLQAVSGEDQAGLAVGVGLGAVAAVTGLITVVAAVRQQRRRRESGVRPMPTRVG